MDLSLAQLPGKFVWNRRQRKREWITTLPVILRDLAPSSGFDPQAVWRREQELDEEEQRKAAEEAASSSKKDKDSGKKAKKEKKVTVSKGAAIIEEAEKKREKKEVEVDMQRITSKKREGAAYVFCYSF